jgi:hypothetical protein
LGGSGRASVAGMPGLSSASERSDDSVFVHFANPIVARDVEIPLPVHRHGIGEIESCLGGGPAIAGETRLSGACHGRDGPMRIHLANGVASWPDAIVPRVRDVHVSFCVECNVGGPAQTGLRCGAAVSELLPTVAYHGLHGGGLLCSVLSTASAGAKREDAEYHQSQP